MRATLLQRVDTRLRQGLPGLLTLLLVLFSVAPLRLPDYAAVTPGLVLISVFYWAVHRPDLFRPWHACVLGLLDDILSGGALGVNAMVLVLVHWIVVAQHRFFVGKGFPLVWSAFALVAPLAIVLTALLSLVASRVAPEAAVVLVQALLTVALYPPVAWLLGRAQRLFLAGL